MSANQSRLALRIDIFEKTDQRAEALSELTPPELIEAILEEFRELEYLGDVPADYLLRKAEDATLLDEKRPLSRQQLPGNTHLVLVEQEHPLPEGTRRPSTPIYLREQPAGKVYKLHWLPAIIGRTGQQQAQQERLAVNLNAQRGGLRVSRRHAQITEVSGKFYVESLASNPTSVEDSSGQRTTLPPNTRHPLYHGDYIYLERSDITLKFIVRNEESM
jgi:hypothetical protein